MTMNLTAPGVYIREVDSGVRVIGGVATSVTAFIGRARRGPIARPAPSLENGNVPTRIFGFADYTRIFGGLWEDSTMGYAVQQFFSNGGAEALIVRVHHPSAVGQTDQAHADLAGEGGGAALLLTAANPGTWGNRVRVRVEHPADPPGGTLFHLIVEETSPEPPHAVVGEERFLNLSVDPNHGRFVARVLQASSDLVRVRGNLPDVRPAIAAATDLVGGDDGAPIDANDVSNPVLAGTEQGLFALDRADLFNLLVIPPFRRALDPDTTADVPSATWAEAATYCLRRRAILLVDPPSDWNAADDVTPANVAGVLGAGPANANAAMYFPRIRAADPLKGNRLETFVASGAIAGVIARTDATRGVWKAPAGQEAAIVGAVELPVNVTHDQNGPINQIGVNALRTFRVPGTVVWGARTRFGADELTSQWKYLNVRRTALYIEEALFRGTQWVVFEGNDEKLWSQIRLNLGAFMHDLFRRGAFQGLTPRDAYFVKCDSETTTQSDIDRGIVNIIVGFAPLKPAEFVVIAIQQIARQAQA